MWFYGGAVQVQSGSVVYSSLDGTMVLKPSAAVLSEDALQLSWGLKGIATEVRTAFACIPGDNIMRFELLFPDAIDGANTSWASPTGVLGDQTPTVQFPSFEIASDGFLASKEAGWLQHDGIWTVFEVWGQGLLNGFHSESANGPMYIYNTSYAPRGANALSSSYLAAGLPSKPPTAIFSPSDHFHTTVVSVSKGPTGDSGRLLWGPRGSIPSIPAGYNSSVILSLSMDGINAAAQQWGSHMTQAYGTRRIPREHKRSLSRQKVSYFSDNGAVYFQSWWDRACPTRNCTASILPGQLTPQELFLELPSKHNESIGFVPGIYQLDTWWFI